MAEVERDKNSKLIVELQHKNEELQVRADEAAKLKDQVDE